MTNVQTLKVREMTGRFLAPAVGVCLCLALCCCRSSQEAAKPEPAKGESTGRQTAEGRNHGRAGKNGRPSGGRSARPEARSGSLALNEAIERRRSVRSFADEQLAMAKIKKLAWSAQGVTSEQGYRACPSAGALYPLELYVATTSGLYHYQPQKNELKRMSGKDLRRELARACLGQMPIARAGAVFIFTAVFERTSRKYGKRAERYVYMEAGHCAQNVLLEAVALGLAAYPVGAFVDSRVSQVLGLPENHEPVYVIPVGHPK